VEIDRLRRVVRIERVRRYLPEGMLDSECRKIEGVDMGRPDSSVRISG
jgi:hypothetical protein